VRDWVNGASKCRLLEAGYSSAVVMTNESTSGQTVKHSLLFFDCLDLASKHWSEVRFTRWIQAPAATGMSVGTA